MKVKTKTGGHGVAKLRGGFSLLEIVIVLGIMGLLLGGAIVAMKRVGDGAALTRVDSDFQAIEAALSMYKLNATTYPTTQQGLRALVTKPSTAPVPKRWTSLMDEVQVDPWGSEYLYRYPGGKNPREPEIYTLGKDGIEGTDDDMSNQD